MKPDDRYFVDGVVCRYDGRGRQVANLSVGGLFVATERPPLRGQVVSLELAIEGQEPFPIVGIVTWVNEGERPRALEVPRGFGVRITKVSLAAKLAIVHLLQRAEGGNQPLP